MRPVGCRMEGPKRAPEAGGTQAHREAARKLAARRRVEAGAWRKERVKKKGPAARAAGGSSAAAYGLTTWPAMPKLPVSASPT